MDKRLYLAAVARHPGNDVDEDFGDSDALTAYRAEVAEELRTLVSQMLATDSPDPGVALADAR